MLEQVVKPLSSGSILPWLTASRIVTTNSLSQLATPSSISSDQSVTLSGAATATVAGLITAQSALTVASTATLQGVTTVVDGNFSIVGSGDSTKTIKFEVDAQTAADDLTINSGAQTDDRTLTVPVLTGNRTLAVIDQAQTFSAAQTISATTGLALTAATGVSLSVTSTASSATRASNSIYTAGGIGIDGAISVDGDGSNVCLYLSPNTALFRCTTANASDTGYFDFSRFSFRDPSNGFADQLLITNGAINIPTTTGTTLTVSSAQDSSSKDTGAIVTEGGVGIEKSLYVGGAVDVTSTVTAASFFRCNRTNSFDTTYCTFFTGCSTFPFFFDATGGMNWGDGTNPVDTILYRGAANQIRTTDQLYVQFSNDSTSVTTGAIFTDGGIGVGKRLTLDGATGKTLRIVNGVANASVATTLGSVGPTGSTAGDPQGWMRVDINGTDRYIPYW